MWNWGHDGVLVMFFEFCERLIIIIRLKWLSLLLTREKIVSLFVVWEWVMMVYLSCPFSFVDA